MEPRIANRRRTRRLAAIGWAALTAGAVPGTSAEPEQPTHLQGTGTANLRGGGVGPHPISSEHTLKDLEHDGSSSSVAVNPFHPQLPQFPGDLKDELELLEHGGSASSMNWIDLDGPSNDFEYYLPPPPPMQARIVGGTTVDNASKYPFSVALRKDGEHWCGGVLVAPQVILTAGHCCNSGERTGADEVIINTVSKHGDLNTSIKRPIDPDACIQHEGYVERGYLYDTCLCPFQGKPINPQKIAPIEINSDDEFPKDYTIHVQQGKSQDDVGVQTFTVMGWGSTSEGGTQTDVMMEVDVAYVDQDRCLRAFKGMYVKRNMLCAISPGRDACQGDSGGPLIYKRANGKPILVGTVSWGFGCADPHYPGVYSRTSDYYDTFLNDTICQLSTSNNRKYWPPAYLKCPGKTNGTQTQSF